MGNASLRGARMLLLSASARERVAERDPPHRARRARDDARLLRALRRRVSVQASPRSARRLRTPAPELSVAAPDLSKGDETMSGASDPSTQPPPFVVIGENVHTTRIMRRPGALIRSDEQGRESVEFVDDAGDTRLLPIPPEELRTVGLRGGPRQARPQRRARGAARAVPTRRSALPTCMPSHSDRSLPGLATSTSTSTSTPTACTSRSRR